MGAATIVPTSRSMTSGPSVLASATSSAPQRAQDAVSSLKPQAGQVLGWRGGVGAAGGDFGLEVRPRCFFFLLDIE